MSKKFYLVLGKYETWPKISKRHPASLTYDDVILITQNSTINSRAAVDTTVKFGPYRLRIPIIAAPMDTICGETMIRALAKLGALGTLPRNGLKHNLTICERLTHNKIPCLYTIGLKDGFKAAQEFKKKGAKIILIDIAHGGTAEIKKTAKKIKHKLGLYVMAGNIATYKQAKEYQKYGIDIARVGVGPGGLCTTRLVAGTGLPQLSAILETTAAKITINADGGIRKPADFCKAIAAGADTIMIGSLLAGTEESPGEIIGGKKYVRGQASSDFMRDNRMAIGEYRAAEGISTTVPLKGSVENIIHGMAGGLRSAMSYTGATTIKEFQKKAIFAPVSSAARSEARPHILE